MNEPSTFAFLETRADAMYVKPGNSKGPGCHCNPIRQTR